jgi:hypothetical protein
LDSGTFSEDSTFMLTDWMAHVPKEVLAKNFRVNASAFDHIPSRELYIMESAMPDVTPQQENVVSPAGEVPLPFTFAASKAPVTNVCVAQARSLRVILNRRDAGHWRVCEDRGLEDVRDRKDDRDGRGDRRTRWPS